MTSRCMVHEQRSDDADTFRIRRHTNRPSSISPSSKRTRQSREPERRPLDGNTRNESGTTGPARSRHTIAAAIFGLEPAGTRFHVDTRAYDWPGQVIKRSCDGLTVSRVNRRGKLCFSF